MSLHSSVVWRGLKHHEKSHRKRGGKRFCLAVKKKIHLQKKSSKFWGTLPPQKKKRKTSLIYDSSTSNLVLQNVPPKPCEFHHFHNGFPWLFLPWSIRRALTPHLWHCRRWRRVGCTLLECAMENGYHPPTPPVSCVFSSNLGNLNITTFFGNSKKKQQNCNTETQEKDILKSLNPENYSLIFSNSKIYKFLPKRKASALVVFTLFKKQTLESPGFFYQNKRPEPPNQTTRKIDKIH